MRLTSFVLHLAPVLAFTIPKGQPDGVYEVSYVDGQEIHSHVEPNSMKALRAEGQTEDAQAKFKRGGVVCGGDALNHGDTDKANGSLDAQCGNGARVGGRLSYYSIAGCTVAYYCNFDVQPKYCYASSRQQASRDITGTCGAYKSGWTNPGYDSYGYENFCKSPGSNFCGHGRN